MFKQLKLTRSIGMLAASAAVLGLATFATTEAESADFSGKRVTIIVPFSEGGSADTWARTMAPYLEKNLPGNPRVLIQNRPGGGGITGANYYHDRPEKDGTSILVLSISTAMNYALRDPRIKFDLDEYYPVVLSPGGITQYVRKDLGVHEIADPKGRIEKLKSLPTERLTFGGRTPTSVDLTYRVGLSLLGVEVNSVWGLGGGGPMALGFERGEFTLHAQSSMTFERVRRHLVEDGTAHALFTLGNFDADGKYGRDPALPDVPTFVEMYKAVHGKDPSGPGFEAWQALMGISVPMNKALVLHPTTPKDVVEAWREAVRAMIQDPDFISKAGAELGPYPQIVGEAARPVMKEALSISPEAREWLADYVKTRYGVDLAAGG